jgi:urease accessory protein
MPRVFDAASPSDGRLARVAARLAVRFAQRDGVTRLADLHQAGSLYARFPRGARATAVTVNNAGGIAGGDVLDVSVAWDAGARATLTSAAAERVYRARPADAPARVRTALAVAEDADAEWLPQETILFDQARLDRALCVDLAPGARFLGVEALVFGRAARGERFATGSLRDRITITRGGVPVLHDALRLDGDIAAVLDRAAVAGGAGAIATLVLAAPDPPLDALRAILPPWAAASLVDGLLVARFVAPDGMALRDAVVAALKMLRDDPLPRTWLC